MTRRIRGFLVSTLRQSWPFYLTIILIFAIGVFAGSSGAQKLQAEQTQELSLYLDQFIRQAGLIEVDSAKALKDVIYNNIVVIVAIYLLGLTIIGIPVMLGIIFTRGFVLGFAITFLTGEKSLQGVILALTAILPQNIFFVPALLMGGVASLSFTILLARRFLNSKVVVWPSFVVYSGLMLIITVLSTWGGLVEVYFTPFLVKLAANYIF